VAEVAVRAELGLEGLDDLALDGVVEEGGTRVTLGLPDGRVAEVRLVARTLEPARPISCRADDLETPLHWEVRALTLGGRAPRTA
jgi:hypothetical protein